MLLEWAAWHFGSFLRRAAISFWIAVKWCFRSGKEEFSAKNPDWTWRQAPKRLLILAILISPIAIAAILNDWGIYVDWRYNAPGYFVIGGILLIALLGPLRSAPPLFKRLMVTAMTLSIVAGAITLAAQLPNEWIFNPPILLAGACILTILLLVTLRSVPIFFKKLVKIGIAILIALALFIVIGNESKRYPPKSAEASSFGLGLLGVALGLNIAIGLIVFSRPRKQSTEAGPQRINQSPHLPSAPAIPRIVRNIPKLTFSDIGGMEEAKEQIRQIVTSQLQSRQHRKYGIVRNGILLHGPRGTGKTFMAEATAGEFKLDYFYVRPTSLVSKWVGETECNIRDMFRNAVSRSPVLIFIDEFDSLGSTRQVLDRHSDPGGASRGYNDQTVEVMQSIDRYRETPGVVIMAATNVLDGLDEAVIREGRFDLKVRIDLPDEAARLKIFQTQLAKKPWKPFELNEFAKQTPGVSPAKIRALVDEATSFALSEGRKIEAGDLRRAIKGGGGKDRPRHERVEWDEVVVEPSIEQDLRALVRLLEDPTRTRNIGMEIPTGLLLVGPPGTGKTLIARLLATQTSRSFYSITAADVLAGRVGGSVKNVSGIFARAKEYSPSLIFIDEMDGLMPSTSQGGAQHDVQVVEQFLTEISNLQAENNVFLVGTTNHPEAIDSRVLRGGRFSEKIVIGLPGPAARETLLKRYLKGTRLEIDLVEVSLYLQGLAAADLQAICTTAKRMAFNRGSGEEIPPLSRSDFEKALERIKGVAATANSGIGFRT